MPILEKWGVYIPGTIGGYFRDVQAWKKVGGDDDFYVFETDAGIVRYRDH